MLTKDSQINHYRIVDKIGEGGMGEVYLAIDSKLQRKVALKFLSEELGKDELFRKRFTNEAQSAAKLNHPNIVTVHEVGEFENRPFIAMAYVTGKNLNELKSIRKLSISEVIDIGIQIAEGLISAHASGITHRDLKPANIVFDENGRVQILDFGLAITNESANAEDTLTRLTQAGSVTGTVPYMSPEQLRGHKIDNRTDIFSFGVILYELLCGQRPFSGASAVEISSSILRDTPKTISEIVEDVPYDLQRIINRCLQKDVERRFQTVKDVRNELEDLNAEDSMALLAVQRAEDQSSKVASVKLDKFVLSAELVRQLESRNSKMIGGELAYMYNNVNSETLAICLVPWGLEQLGIDKVLEELPCRAVAPSLFGWDMFTKFRPAIPLKDHSIILRSLFKSLVKRFGTKKVVFTGFSASADHILHMLSSDEGTGVPLDGLLINGCNLDLSTCFVSRVLAEIEPDSEYKFLETLNGLSKNAGSINDWILTQNYLLAILQKFGENIEPVKQFASDIVKPFRTNERDQFAEWYRNAVSKIPHVRFVFSTDDAVAMDRILQRHLEENLLGDNYSERTIKRMDLSHIQTGQPKATLELVRELLREMAE